MMATGRRSWPRWTIARRTSAVTFLGLLVLGHCEWFGHFSGSTTATRIGQLVPLADPLAAAEVTLATQSMTWEMAVGAGALLLVAAILGPVFCGWVCPLGLLLDLSQSLRKRIWRWVGRRPRDACAAEGTRSVRFALLGIVLGFSSVASIPLFQVVSPINVVAWVAAITWTVDVGLILVGAVILVEQFFPRLWCRVLCPLGALHSLAGSVAPWRIRVSPGQDAQLRCRQCTLNCPMGIDVMDGYVLPGRPSVGHIACTRCGSCIEACPGAVLSLGFRPREPQREAVTIDTYGP